MSDTKIITLSDRGTLTLPKVIREKFGTRYYQCKIGPKNITLEPMQTRDEFLAELDEREAEWKKNGGIPLAEIKKKYNLK